MAVSPPRSWRPLPHVLACSVFIPLASKYFLNSLVTHTESPEAHPLSEHVGTCLVWGQALPSVRQGGWAPVRARRQPRASAGTSEHG